MAGELGQIGPFAISCILVALKKELLIVID